MVMVFFFFWGGGMEHGCGVLKSQCTVFACMRWRPTFIFALGGLSIAAIIWEYSCIAISKNLKTKAFMISLLYYKKRRSWQYIFFF